MKITAEKQEAVYCHACSRAGGADRAIYHLPPVCPDPLNKQLEEPQDNWLNWELQEAPVPVIICTIGGKRQQDIFLGYSEHGIHLTDQLTDDLSKVIPDFQGRGYWKIDPKHPLTGMLAGLNIDAKIATWIDGRYYETTTVRAICYWPSITAFMVVEMGRVI